MVAVSHEVENCLIFHFNLLDVSIWTNKIQILILNERGLVFYLIGKKGY